MKNKLYFKLNFTLLILFTFLLLASPIISAAGIASPYWEDYPLEMYYGETRIINFNLQNIVGEEDITVKVEIKEGKEIASLEQNTYTAKLGTSDTKIPVTITIPKDYEKSIQKVSLEFIPIDEKRETGMVSLGTGWINSFNVVLSEKPISSSFLIGIIIALLVILILLISIILVLITRKKN